MSHLTDAIKQLKKDAQFLKDNLPTSTRHGEINSEDLRVAFRLNEAEPPFRCTTK
jgi:hypothetical protein